eukprot:1925464-Amphidinium_carterae.1
MVSSHGRQWSATRTKVKVRKKVRHEEELQEKRILLLPGQFHTAHGEHPNYGNRAALGKASLRVAVLKEARQVEEEGTRPILANLRMSWQSPNFKVYSFRWERVRANKHWQKRAWVWHVAGPKPTVQGFNPRCRCMEIGSHRCQRSGTVYFPFCHWTPKLVFQNFGER